MTKKSVTEKESVNIDKEGRVDTTLDSTPMELPPLEDVVLNLAFWLDMLRQYGPQIMQKRMRDGLPKTDKTAKS